MLFDRRTFLAIAGAAAARSSATAQQAVVELGAIQGSVSQMKWTPVEFLDYLSKTGLQHAMISLPREVLLDESELKQIREYADVSPFSDPRAWLDVSKFARSFNASLGTVEEQLAPALECVTDLRRTIDALRAGQRDRTPRNRRHIENMLGRPRHAVRIQDSGVKLAMENHGGDLQAREMKALVEAAGRDIVGVCLDSGNPVWMLEDPHMTLEMLGPMRRRPTSGIAPSGASPKASPCDGSIWAKAMWISMAGFRSSSPCVLACR